MVAALALTMLVSATSGAAAEAPVTQAPAADALCRTLVRVSDPLRDGRSWITPSRTPWRGTAPSGDMQRFELGAGADGVCARWTVAAPPPDGSQLVLGMWAPPQRSASGAITSFGYGYAATLTPTGAVLAYGRDRRGSNAPRLLRGRILRNGRVVTILVPRSELDRAPANAPRRPAFPFSSLQLRGEDHHPGQPRRRPGRRLRSPGARTGRSVPPALGRLAGLGRP